MNNDCQHCGCPAFLDTMWVQLAIDWRRQAIDEVVCCEKCGRELRLLDTPDSVTFEVKPNMMITAGSRRFEKAGEIAKNVLLGMIQNPSNLISVAQEFNRLFMEFGTNMVGAGEGFRQLSKAMKDFGNAIYGIPTEFAHDTGRPVDSPMPETVSTIQVRPVNITGGLKDIRKHLQKG